MKTTMMRKKKSQKTTKEIWAFVLPVEGLDQQDMNARTVKTWP